MESPAKGKVTPLASMFPEEEARKAAKRVEEQIGGKQREMNRLGQFVSDNADIINLVKKLPDQLHHDIMVPFGKMAFFPGRLIHTNEFLVLLGENYHVERTSKQTVDILKRREKSLKSQFDSIKAEIEDLQAKASFFSATASDAAEGLVEIREEYVEETSSRSMPESGKHEPSDLPEGENAEDEVNDDEFARILARLDELEMEELMGEDENGRDEEEDSGEESSEESDNDVNEEVAHMISKLDELEREELQDEIELNRVVDEESDAESSSDRERRISEELGSFEPLQKPRCRNTSVEVLPEKHPGQKYSLDQLNCTGLTVQHFGEENTSRGGIPSRSVFAAPVVSKGKAETNILGAQTNESPVQKPKPDFDSSKAFIGSIIEHAHNLEPKTQGEVQSTSSQPSKPVSRFKAQRR